MSGSRTTNLYRWLATLGVVGQAALVGAVVVCLWLVAAPVSYQFSDAMGLIAAATAAGLCLLGAALALATMALVRGSSAPMMRMLLGMFSRAFVPLLLGVWLHFQVPALAQAGMVYYLLVFYMATLVTETLIMLARVPSAHAQAPARPVSTIST